MGLEFTRVDMELADRLVVPELRQCALLLDIDGTILDLAPAPQEVWVPAELRNTLSRLEDLTGGALALRVGTGLGGIFSAAGLGMTAFGCISLLGLISRVGYGGRDGPRAVTGALGRWWQVGGLSRRPKR